MRKAIWGLGSLLLFSSFALNASAQISAPSFVATSTSATSTFAGGIAAETSGFVYDFSSNRVGVGTANPLGPLHVNAGSNRAIIEVGSASVLSPLNLWNSNGGSSAGTGMLFSAGASPTAGASFIGGVASQRIDASSNSRTALRVQSNGSFTGLDTSAVFYVEGNSIIPKIIANGRLGVATTSPWKPFSVAGDASITGAIFDNFASSGGFGDVLQSTGTGFQWVATSTLGIGGGGGGSPAGSDKEIQYNDSGSFGANSNLAFHASKAHPTEGFSGPALQIGEDDTASLNIYKRYPDPAMYLSANNAPVSSDRGGTQLLLMGGNADGNNRGGTVWLLSGVGGGTEQSGDVLISANTNSSNGGNVIIGTTESQISSTPHAVGLEATTEGSNIPMGLELAHGRITMNGHQTFYYSTPAPSIGDGSSDCGTSPLLEGGDNIGRVTVGSGTNGGKCTITFGHEWTGAGNPPVCMVQMEGTTTPVYPDNVTTTEFEIAGALSPGDKIVYRCVGYY